jgi:hypothetical protein
MARILYPDSKRAGPAVEHFFFWRHNVYIINKLNDIRKTARMRMNGTSLDIQ